MSAGFALRQAILDTLIATPAVTAALGAARVFDSVPPRTEYPYVTFGASSERDWSTGTDTGFEHAVTLTVWSRAAGRKEIDTAAAAIRAALHDASLAMTGHRLVNLRHEATDIRREDDGETYAGMMRFRAVTEIF